jgi:hypothetical protein
VAAMFCSRDTNVSDAASVPLGFKFACDLERGSFHGVIDDLENGMKA